LVTGQIALANGADTYSTKLARQAIGQIVTNFSFVSLTNHYTYWPDTRVTTSYMWVTSAIRKCREFLHPAGHVKCTIFWL
jgi:hypothetical protein